MAFARDAGVAADLVNPMSGDQLAVPMSLNVVSPMVAVADLVWIVLLGVATGCLYGAAAQGRIGDAANFLGSGIAVAALYSAFAHAAHVYRVSNLLRFKWQVGRSVLIWLIVFAFLATLVFLLKIGPLFSRGEMLLFFASGIAVLVAMRLAVARACTYLSSSGALKSNRVVLAGMSDELAANDALSGLEAYGYVVVDVFSVPVAEDGDLAEEALKARMREVVSYVRQTTVDEIILAIPWDRPDLIRRAENELRVLPVPVKLVPDTVTSRVLKRPLFELGPTKAVELQRAPLSAAQRKLKRITDQILAVVVIILLLPLFAVIAAAIRLESPGPAMFLQMRVGFNGRPFRIFKFRTMSTQDDGPVVIQATKNDKRITRLGELLRKLSIDEFPQLFNVLRGEMSLVGPRPHAVAHDNQYHQLIATYAFRHKMKPGMTGWAQVNGFRGETAEIGMMEKRVENDLWYIEYWSLWLDIRILLMTIVRVLKTDKAY